MGSSTKSGFAGDNVDCHMGNAAVLVYLLRLQLANYVSLQRGARGYGLFLKMQVWFTMVAVFSYWCGAGDNQ